MSKQFNIISLLGNFVVVCLTLAAVFGALWLLVFSFKAFVGVLG